MFAVAQRRPSAPSGLALFGRLLASMPGISLTPPGRALGKRRWLGRPRVPTMLVLVVAALIAVTATAESQVTLTHYRNPAAVVEMLKRCGARPRPPVLDRRAGAFQRHARFSHLRPGHECHSLSRRGSYATYLTFRLLEERDVQIDMRSPHRNYRQPSFNADAYLYLWSIPPVGNDIFHAVTHVLIASDDDGGPGEDARIVAKKLRPGVYMVEATTFSARTITNDAGRRDTGRAGFRLSVVACSTDLGTLGRSRSHGFDPVSYRYRRGANLRSSCSKSGVSSRYYDFELREAHRVDLLAHFEDALTLSILRRRGNERHDVVFRTRAPLRSTGGPPDYFGTPLIMSRELAAGAYSIELSSTTDIDGSVDTGGALVVSLATPSSCIIDLGSLVPGTSLRLPGPQENFCLLAGRLAFGVYYQFALPKARAVQIANPRGPRERARSRGDAGLCFAVLRRNFALAGDSFRLANGLIAHRVNSRLPTGNWTLAVFGSPGSGPCRGEVQLDVAP